MGTKKPTVLVGFIVGPRSQVSGGIPGGCSVDHTTVLPNSELPFLTLKDIWLRCPTLSISNSV